MSVRKHQGVALTNMLFFMVVLFGLLSLSAGTWMFQMTMNGKSSSKDGARRLAEAAAQVAIGRLVKDQAANATTFPNVDLTLPSYPKGHGVLALSPSSAQALGVPISVNNLKGATNVSGWDGGVVAKETASLVAVGRYNGQESRVEVILNVPAFPYVLASSVPLKAIDGLTVFGISDPDALVGGFNNIPPEKKTPGHIVTNAPDPSPGVPSLELNGSHTRIEGDAQSRGQVVVGPGAVVVGERRPMANDAPLPALNITGLDTIGKPGFSNIGTAQLNAPKLSGFQRRTGDLTITGGLDLQGAILYVQGSVNITGGIKGSGAVISTGPVKVDGGGLLTGENQAAILSKGAVMLEGAPGFSEEFRGLIYTEGNLDCKHAKIAGSVVVNNPDPTGQVRMEQVTFAESRQLAAINVDVIVPGSGGMDAGDFGFHFQDQFTFPPQTVPFSDGSGNYTGLVPDIKIKWNVVDYGNPPAGFPITHQPTAREPWYEIGEPSPPPSDPLTLAKLRIGNADPNGAIDPRSLLQGPWAEYRDISSARSAMLAAVAGWPGTSGGAAEVDSYLQAAQGRILQGVPQFVTAFNYNAKWLAKHPSANGQIPALVPWHLDLSEFFNMSQRIRILSWRQLD